MLVRVLISSALVAYIAAFPPDGLPPLVWVWTTYALVDGLATLVSLAPLSPRDGRFTPVLLQAVWSLGAALAGFLTPRGLYLMLFVALPLWSVGSTVLALTALQQVRTVIEARWLVAIVVLATAAFAGVFTLSPIDQTAWLSAALAASGAANGAIFLLAARSVRGAPAVGA